MNVQAMELAHRMAPVIAITTGQAKIVRSLGAPTNAMIMVPAWAGVDACVTSGTTD